MREALVAELAGRADAEVLDYASSCLADGDLDWRDDGAFDAVGAVLLEACGDEEENVKALLSRLFERLHVGAAPPAAAAPPAEATRRATPFVMGALTSEEAGTVLGKVAKGVIVACARAVLRSAAPRLVCSDPASRRRAAQAPTGRSWTRPRRPSAARARR